MCFRPGAEPSPGSMARIASLSALLEAAGRFEKRKPIANSQMRRLLAAGGTPGGARSKALIDHAGASWIVMSLSCVLDEGLDIVRLEAAGLALARRAGIDVPEFDVLWAGKRAVLLVKRFDLVPGGGGVTCSVFARRAAKGMASTCSTAERSRRCCASMTGSRLVRPRSSSAASFSTWRSAISTMT